MLELKLHPPTDRPGIVHRRSVLDKLEAAADARLVVIVAPPGYGKTTVMAQWMESITAPTAWLTLDRIDNDPAVLISGLATTLRAAGILNGEVVDQRTASDVVLTHGVANFLESLERAQTTGTILLDQVDSLRSRSSLDVLSSLLTQLPPGINVALTARSGAGLPLPILRSRGAVTELSMADLAMDEGEAKELLDNAGVRVESEFSEILERTEGWPAGLYLTALAIRAGAPASPAPYVRGDDIFVADYLRQEVLGRLSEARMSFLTRTSILTRLSGPLCDHLLQRTGSGRQLDRLEGSNLLIIPIDRTRTWYRYHSLLQDFLRSELERREPEGSTVLHSRAADWLEAHGQPEAAIEHAIAAGDSDRVAKLVSEVARATYAKGLMETLSGWFNWLEGNGAIANFPETAALGSFARSLEGDQRGAERLAQYAFFGLAGEPLADDQLGVLARMVRSFRAETGPERALADARAARGGLPPSSQWNHVVMAAEALALVAMGERDEADAIWAEAVLIGEEMEALPLTTAGLTERALIAWDQGDWEAVEGLIQRSLDRIEKGGLEHYITSALAFVIAARLAIRRGDIDGARAYMGRATAIRPRMTVGMPILSIQALLEMTRTFIELADVAGARRVMREASDIVAERPRLGELRVEHDELKERLAALPAGSVGASSLTSAELRLLPMLVTHLTYPEIGERLFVSRHTVKTQAMSIYRKLGVSSRTEAVDAARAIGLLGS